MEPVPIEDFDWDEDEYLQPDDDERHEAELEDFEEEDAEAMRRPGGHLWRTTAFAAFLATRTDEDIAMRLVEVIDFMATKQLDLTTFVDLVSWGFKIPSHMRSVAAIIRGARTSLMHSEQLPGVIRRWHRPPRRHGWGVKTHAARTALEDWALEAVTARINREMREYAPNLASPPESINEDDLLSIKLKDDIMMMKSIQPTFWNLMDALSFTPLQKKRCKKKDNEARIFMIGNVLHYSRSQRRCRYQKLLSIYFKACGLGAKANDTTHLFGLTMSQKWVYRGIEAISDSNRRRMMEDIALYVFFGGHDNLNLPFRTYQQRIDHQSRFDNGTAGTIYIIRDENVQFLDRVAYMEQRMEQCNNPITAVEICRKAGEFGPRLHAQAVFSVLRILLQTPAFAGYTHKDHDVFKAPPPVQQLPIGKEHATVMYMLDTVHMEESSQDGNRKVLEEWLRQLNLDGENATKHPAAQRLIVWIGDQLTAVRIRYLKRDRAFDNNFVQRFEQFLEIFGWFHAQIAQEFSMHKQYYGNNHNLGLSHAFAVMERKGLATPSIKGNFHYTFREAVMHTAEARFRDVWTVVGGVDKLEELQDRTPEELEKLAQRIVTEYASTEALVNLRAPTPTSASDDNAPPPAKKRKAPGEPPLSKEARAEAAKKAREEKERKAREKKDDLFEYSVQFNRDLLEYLDLNDAMKTGDVGRMEYLLPRLLFRFHGGGNHKYAWENVELMQELWREWPPEIKSLVMRFCWLANTTGLAGNFLAYDMVQEHNIRDIKDLFAIHGPFSSWEYIKRISASIPTQRKIKKHVEEHFNHFKRGLSHTSPAHEKDVVALQQKYRQTGAHVHRPGRHLAKSDRAKDFTAIGANLTTLQSMIDRWHKARVTEKRRTDTFESVMTLVEQYKERAAQRASTNN